MERFVAVVLTLATIDLGSKAMAHGAGLLEPVRNHGLALGIVDVGTGTELLVMLVGLFGGGTWLIRRASTGRSRFLTAALIVGGAGANLADRLLHGSVRDFIPTPWAVLNLADLFLLAGVTLLYSELLRGTGSMEKSRPENGKVGSAGHRHRRGPYAPMHRAELRAQRVGSERPAGDG